MQANDSVTIKSVEAVQFFAPLIIPGRYGTIVRLKSASVLIRLRGSNDLVGYGEACAVPQLTGETTETIVSLVDLYLREMISGTNALDWRSTMAGLRRRFPKTFVGLSAIETAFIDLAGKTLGTPAYAIIGSRYRDRVELCASVSWNKDAKVMAADAAEKSGEYRVIKTYLGADALAPDLKRLETVRSALKDDVKIMLDIKGLWSNQTAISVGPTLKDLGVFLVEQPVSPKDHVGAKNVTRAYRDNLGLVTAADESIETTADAFRLTAGQEFSSLNVGVTKMAGPDVALQAASVANAGGMPVFIGSFAELGIATAAGIHLAVAIPELAAPSYLDGPSRYKQKITHPHLIPEGGYAILPSGPGLGVEVDEELIASMATR